MTNTNAAASMTSAMEEDNEESPQQALISNLDRTLSRFSDDPSGYQPPPLTSTDNILRTYSPPHQEKTFQELYSTVWPCLSGSRTTSAAILMGPHGSGKNLLVHRCLEACRHQLDAKNSTAGTAPKAHFHTITIQGMTRGDDDVSHVMYDIVRQLNDIAGNPQTRVQSAAFSSNVALLNSALQMAQVDQIPIVLIIKELDAFLQQKRQVLLYHLLDRVATPGSHFMLIGLTTHFQIWGLMEKRIHSRAAGTTKFITLRPLESYDQLVDLLQDKLKHCVIASDIVKSCTESDSLSNTLQREFQMARGVGWFCRVFMSAISLYRFHCILEDAPVTRPPPFTSDFLVEALAMMSAASLTDQDVVSTTQSVQLGLVRDVAVDPRLQALRDLSVVQLTLMLAARRILAREAQRDISAVYSTPLTLQRMIQEVQTFRVSSQSQWVAVGRQLLDRGVLVPSMDHSGRGPLQYELSMTYKTLDTQSFLRLPLHFPVELEREFNLALQRNWFQEGSTRLLEWGRKTY
eukprot:Nitzschia sp. Nitz4//scaffold55_size114948//66294//67847//NITZ4_003905-RA/size114948-processed-gene-0.232-mRNA-1//-1//CDS//3329554542//5324//frame0